MDLFEGTQRVKKGLHSRGNPLDSEVFIIQFGNSDGIIRQQARIALLE